MSKRRAHYGAKVKADGVSASPPPAAIAFEDEEDEEEEEVVDWDMIERSFDTPDYVIDLRGHIVGMALSGDQRCAQANECPLSKRAFVGTCSSTTGAGRPPPLFLIRGIRRASRSGLSSAWWNSIRSRCCRAGMRVIKASRRTTTASSSSSTPRESSSEGSVCALLLRVKEAF